MRLMTRLADRRWSIFTNYDDLGITSTAGWFKSLGFGAKGPKITVLDLSMLAHEALPFVCATFGRVLLEAREKLEASERYANPWVLVLEEAHNYARPARQGEDRGQALSRRAFERVAKEGRKFGLLLIVASQRPSEISPTIMSQCANFFSHRHILFFDGVKVGSGARPASTANCSSSASTSARPQSGDTCVAT